MGEKGGTLVWFRRDLRLADHRALSAAVERGWVVPVFILDPSTEEAGGAAARWRLSQSLRSLADGVASKGGRLILRRGEALPTLKALLDETGADAVFWSRRYDADGIAQDTEVKAALKAASVRAESFTGTLLAEPFAVATQA
ncbi:MAG: deoxyribodipyrimidine photo-lyase, partial [Pseudomonadota bacterium]